MVSSQLSDGDINTFTKYFTTFVVLFDKTLPLFPDFQKYRDLFLEIPYEYLKTNASRTVYSKYKRFNQRFSTSHRTHLF